MWAQNLLMYQPGSKQKVQETIAINDINDPALKKHIGDKNHEILTEELTLVQGVYPEFERES